MFTITLGNKNQSIFYPTVFNHIKVFLARKLLPPSANNCFAI